MNYTEKTILTDVDGCLLDWEAMFTTWMLGNGYKQDPTQGHMYNLGARWNITEKKVHELISAFNCSAAIGFCPPCKDSVKYVRKLAGHGFRFTAITSMGGDEYSHSLRNMNLRSVFGDVFDDCHIIPLNTSKREILNQWSGSELWWIEDKLENAVAGLEFGLRPILISYEHNKNHEDHDLLVVDDWKGIYSIITGEEHCNV